MSSSSKLSFQSGDSPSARRKSWPGFHGLKALDFGERMGAGSGNLSAFPLVVSASAQNSAAPPSRRVDALVPERLPDAPGRRPVSPPPHVPSLVLPDAQEDSSRPEPGECQAVSISPRHCQLRDLLNMWGMTLLWSAWEKSHTAKPL